MGWSILGLSLSVVLILSLQTLSIAELLYYRFPPSKMVVGIVWA